MSRRDVLIGKLSAMMDPDNARALVDEVTREREHDLFHDHSVALEFMRELASVPCKWGCASHPEERTCIRCRASAWLHKEGANYMPLDTDRLRTIEQRANAGGYHCEHFAQFDADDDVLFLLAIVARLRSEAAANPAGNITPMEEM